MQPTMFIVMMTTEVMNDNDANGINDGKKRCW